MRIAFPGCQTGEGPYLELFAFDLTPTDATRDVLLSVAVTIPPSDPNFDCPFVTRCDGSASKVCVNGFGAWINGGSCPLAVEPLTWGQLKAMYD